MERILNNTPELPANSALVSNIQKYENCKGYAIDTIGNVWTCKNHNFQKTMFKDEWRKLTLKNNKHGYPYVIIMDMIKRKHITVKVHHLVSMSFLPNPNNYPIVNHIDGDKKNNIISNLEWCTHAHNCKHCLDNGLRNTAKGERVKGSKLKETDIIDIFNYRKEGMLHKQIADIYNLDTSCITRILSRENWAHVILPS